MYLISKEALQHLLNYLAERPYKEVAGLIQIVQSAKPHEEKQKESEEKKEPNNKKKEK